jgi:hypothetical protein
MFSRYRLIKRTLLLSFPVLLLCLGSLTAQAVQISPPRAVIGPDKKTSYVYIKNNTENPQAYRFRWKNLAMDKDGNLRNLDAVDASLVPDFKPAESYIRFSPRRTTLRPGETQRVTFLVRRPPEMADGEYRSHFVVEQIPQDTEKPEEEVRIAEEQELTTTGVGVKIVVSRAFPVYLLNGAVHANLSLDNAQLKINPNTGTKDQSTHTVDLDFSKTGNRSIIATADVLCGGTSISRAPRLFAVYAEADRRSEVVFVDPSLAKDCSNMRVVIKAHQDDQLAGQILAESPVKR